MTRQPANTRPDSVAKTMVRPFVRVFCPARQAQRQRRDGYPGCQPIDPRPRDGRPVPAYLRGVRRRALPDRARLRGRCQVALGTAGAAPKRRHPGRGGRRNRDPRRDRRMLARGRRRIVAGRGRSGGEADQTPVRGRGGGEGERCGVRDRRRRLSCLRHRQRPQAATGRADDG